MKQFLTFVFLVMLVVEGYGQELWRKNTVKMTPSVCRASGKVHKSFVAPPLNLKSASAKKSVITVDYIGFPNEAKLAFQYAVDIWQNVIYSPVPIHVKATWESLDKDILGNCSPTNYFTDFNSTQTWNCYYPVALVEKMLGEDVNLVTDYDLEASFNKDFTNWYFGTDGNTPVDKYDFVSTVLHEMAHGLGFHGFFHTDSRSRGAYGGSDGFAAVFDQSVTNKNGEKLVDTRIFVNPSTKLYQNFTSGWLEFDSKLAEGALPRLYAPPTWDSGSSIYHLDDGTYPFGDPNSLMTHALDKGEAIHSPGPNTLAIMNDMGWKSILIRHTQLKDIEFVSSPVNFDAQIESDFDLDSTKLYLVYSADKFLKSDSIQLKPTSTATVFRAVFQPVQNASVQYYFSAKDVKNRTFVFPSNAPSRHFSFTTGTDKTAPVVTHDPVKMMLSSNPSVKIEAVATDNIGIISVKVEYFVNGGLVKELAMVNDSADRFTGTLAFSEGSVRGGDIISYRVAATDVSSQSNVGRSPLSGYNTFKIEAVQSPVDRYVTNFDASNPDFIGSDLTISQPTGFDTPALNTAHPYASPDTDNTRFNFSTILSYPILLNSKGNMAFDEIVLVEPGEAGSKFGDQNFWDYVIVEGSKDGGATWKPLADGYDSNAQMSWLNLWNSSISGNNSTAVPTKDLFVKHEINMLANGNFKAGDTILIRFRLFSDPYSHGWGWIIDNLAIQDWETAVSPAILSSGEVNYFPNPATGRLNIQVEAKKDIRNLILKAYNSSGKPVFIQAFPVESNLFQTNIDVSGFIPGLYLFTLEPEQGQTISRKIMVLK